MENIHGGVIGCTFGGLNTECYQTIIGYAVASVINMNIEIIKIKLDAFLDNSLIVSLF